MIEIRPIGGVPFTCRAVGVELRTEQRVQTSSALGLSETTKETKICEDPQLYSPPVGEFYQELLALDVPVLLPLPKDITPSAYFEKWGATTVHYLYVKFTGGTSTQSEYSFLELFAVPVKTYDTLPIYRQFIQRISESGVLADNQLVMTILLPRNAFGPRDVFLLEVEVKANPLHNRRKRNLQVKQMTLQMREVFLCHDGGLPTRKENKFVSNTVDLDKLLDTGGIRHEFEFLFPLENDGLDIYKKPQPVGGPVHAASALFNKNRNFTKLADGVPLTHVQNFTIQGKLYSLQYEITVKAKINHGKDIDITVPIVVSPYDSDSSTYMLDWVRRECSRAQTRFGKEMVMRCYKLHAQSDIQQVLNHVCDAPHIYAYNRGDWSYLGYDPQAFGKQGTGRPLVTFID